MAGDGAAAGIEGLHAGQSLALNLAFRRIADLHLAYLFAAARGNVPRNEDTQNFNGGGARVSGLGRRLKMEKKLMGKKWERGAAY